jgi:hypothetical protein
MSRIGVVMLLGGAIMFALGLTGISELVPSLVIATVLAVIGATIFLIGRSIGRSFEHDAALVQELATRGIRRRGIVKDIVPYASAHGGAVFQPEGAQLVVRIELESDTGAGRTVSCQLVEHTEDARQRIGSSVVVLEHPESSTIRALEGYLPNGRRRAA